MATRSRLTVILHADVVGSTTLVRLDEALAHERIQTAFKVFSKVLRDYGGEVHEIRGDALVASFPRASDAVLASLAAQQRNAEHNVDLIDGVIPEIRVGIALGEVIIADDTLTGAGVVLAQRLEQLARPGGVCISAAVREALPDRLPLNHEDLGAQKIKGFDLPVVANAVSLRDGEMLPPASRPPRGLRAVPPRWRRAVGAVLFVTTFLSGLIWLQSGTTDVEPAVLTRLSHPLPDRPSVAVLPFTNLSDGIEGQDQFAEGVSEDIITDLSKVSGLFVVARDAAFAHDSPERVVGQVAEALGVRYVLDGGVRRSGNRVRVTTQLVDALHGKIIWAERYDRNLKDVFAVQSDVASQVARAMAVTLKSGEHERLFQKHVASIDAYDVFIRARRTVDVPSRANIETGEKLFMRVIELDPAFAGGYAGLSFNYSVKARFGFGRSRSEDTQRSLEFANKAIALDPHFGWSYVALGGAQLAAGDPVAAAATMRRALALLPGDYEVHLFSGLYMQFAGQSAEAIDHLELARRINPIDTDRNTAFLGMAYFMNGDYAKAERLWRIRNEKFPAGSALPLVFLAASYSLQGNLAEARAVATRLRKDFPAFRLEAWGWSRTYHLPENRDRLHRGARLAGVA